MIWASAAVLGSALAAPHLLPQLRLPAATAITLWLAALLLRALLSVALVSALVLYFPATELFGALTHWCIHAVIPVLAAHLGFSGHGLADGVTMVPAIALVVSSLWVAFGIWRGARAVQRWIQRCALGTGPGESIVVGEPGIILAAAGLRRPRVVVSADALATLDEGELTAGLEHERGHIARRHRFAFLAGNLLFALARLLPGSRPALQWLHFHLERDADDYAVRRTGDPLALASAICKVAGASGVPATPAIAAQLSGSGAPDRLRILLATNSGKAGPSTMIAKTLAVGLISFSVALVLTAPSWATPVAGQAGSASAVQFCPP